MTGTTFRLVSLRARDRALLIAALASLPGPTALAGITATQRKANRNIKHYTPNKIRLGRFSWLCFQFQCVYGNNMMMPYIIRRMQKT